ncbi:hypothetical protein ADE_11530 [Achromobacter denitrificans]|uniref:hypothetical protein n=1 Tax=Achromobacter denitrificans TaxID=32002 RepID=UPI000AF576E6|nr:hypothetical protein [Achromobacter denitrificans]GFN25455.1 hypothetical protein ADE_11530 [Achromobacter denitrificans]
MSAQHTPGPWEIDGEYVQQAGQTAVAVCDVLNMDKAGDKGWYSGPVTQANKRLISAAPELLEALEKLNAAYDRFKLPGYPKADVQKQAEAAIAKAKGEQQ